MFNLLLLALSVLKPDALGWVTLRASVFRGRNCLEVVLKIVSKELGKGFAERVFVKRF